MGPIPAIAFVLLIGGVASQSSRCPNGEIEHSCLIDPCTYTDCAPGHRCESNYCGGCNAECVSICSPVQCRMWCPNGFKRDKDGCEICQCVDACATIKCARGYVCKDGQCVADVCTHNGQSYAVGDNFPRGDGCNTCFCDSGNNVGCTEIFCPHCQYNGYIYKPGDSFNSTDGCNTCTCSENGQVGCTEKACLPATQCSVDGKTYNVGENFPSSDGCNTCTCSDSGFPICTLIACPQCQYNGNIYKPGDSFNSIDGCNTCHCSDSGQVACTKRACLPADGCTHNGQNYAVGDRFPRGDGCNTCFCDSGNNVGCTEVYCPHCEYNGYIYKLGDSFNSTDGCNTCTCSENGQVACTQKACLPVCPVDKPFTQCPYNPCIAALCITGTTCVADQCGGCFAKCVPQQIKQCSVDGKTYKVGESFPSSDGCNTCTCSDSGVPICTLRACFQCPQYKCKACTTGHVIDENGCQTCECQDPSCEGVQCPKGSFCSDSYCCPDQVKSIRCADPCANKYCGFFKVCKRYCNCYADCVWWFLG